MDVYQGNYNEVHSMVPHNCYAELWIKYIEGLPVTSLDCMECDINLERSYNCAIFRSDSLAYTGEYEGAYQTLANFLDKHRETIQDNLGIISGLTNKIEVLKFLDENLPGPRSSIENLEVDYDFNPVSQRWNQFSDHTVDTAATYSTAKGTPESHRLIESRVSTFSGAQHTLSLGLKTILEVNGAVYFNANEDLIGINHLSNIDNIFLRHNSEFDSHQVKLYRDQNNFFFLADVKIHEVEFENVNICVDSGSEQTFLMPKMYKKIRELVADLPIMRFSATEVIGGMEGLGRVVEELHFRTEQKSYKLTEVPAIFRAEGAPICDFVLGQDFLQKNMKSFSLKNRIINLI